MEPLLTASRFRVTIGDDVVGFCRVAGLVVDDRGERPVVRLERALSSSRLLFDWRMAEIGGKTDPRDVLIEQFDEAGEQVVVGFFLARSSPIAWYAPTWDTRVSEIAIEAIEITYDELTWIDDVRGGS
jgi:phage tail-like protein